MAFPKQASKAYTKASIESLPEGLKGCYGLFTPGKWIYVGKSEDIRRRLLEHLDGDNTCISASSPTHFVFETTQNMDKREQELILECQPACNKKVG